MARIAAMPIPVASIVPAITIGIADVTAETVAAVAPVPVETLLTAAAKVKVAPKAMTNVSTKTVPIVAMKAVADAKCHEP